MCMATYTFCHSEGNSPSWRKKKIQLCWQNHIQYLIFNSINVIQIGLNIVQTHWHNNEEWSVESYYKKGA